MDQKETGVKKINVGRAERAVWAMPNKIIPAYMVTMVAELDATGLELLRQKYKQRGRTAPSFTALVIKAAALTMKKYPEANRAILGLPFFKNLFQFTNTNISVAVEKNLPGMPGNPFATPILRPEEQSLEALTEQLKNLATCTEENHPGFAEYMKILKYVPRPFSLWLINAPYIFPKLWSRFRGCAAWVNAPSKAGADLVMTAWPWPITFSFGVVRKRPWVVDDRVEVRMTMPIVMVFDRRIMGGGPAGRIFASFKNILESQIPLEENLNISRDPLTNNFLIEHPIEKNSAFDPSGVN